MTRRRPSNSELEVLALVSQGLSYREVAEATGRSLNTIRNWMSLIFMTLNVHSREDAVAKARKLRYIP